MSRSILISAPREAVRDYLRDLRNMSEYEQKVDRVETVEYPQPETGFVDVSGKFLGMPWRGSFKMDFTSDGGFRSEMVRGPLRRMQGGFHLRAVAGGTLLTHDEQYQFPVLLRPLMYLCRGWIRRSMDLELGIIKEGAERLNRSIQLRAIESAR